MTRTEAIVAMRFYKEKLYNGIFNRYIDAFDMAIAALKEQDVTDINVGNKWISVEERLPENNDKVLAFTLSGKYAVARYDQRRQCWIAAGNLTVTHWMPLPELPEEG